MGVIEKAKDWLEDINKRNKCDAGDAVLALTIVYDLIAEVERLEKDCQRKQQEINRRDEVCLQCSISYESQLSRYEGAVEVEGHAVKMANVFPSKLISCNFPDKFIGQRVTVWVKGKEESNV